jgi:hypothetical protein
MKGPKPKPTTGRDPEEYKRFLETARQVGADKSPAAFDRAFKRIVKPQSEKPRK